MAQSQSDKTEAEKEKDRVIRNVKWWKDATVAHMDDLIHGKDDYEIHGIAGHVMIDFGDSWDRNSIKHIRNCLLDRDFTIQKFDRGNHILRIAVSDDRLQWVPE